MPHIQQLSSHVADLIAAGEVVERPASVVKELVENAIDAGASAIVVEIQRGGMGLIRVTDNGCGIAPDELPTAFLRHATSKLRTEEDLGKIGTLGFRGEALAAISAVSRVDVLTRQSEDAIGAAIHGEGGAMGPVREEGAPAGTTIRVADLFYNTPARLKFMKKDSAETAAVAGLMQHLALSHPDISFKFIKDGQETLHTPGDGKLESAVYAALGREFAKTLVPVEGRGGAVTLPANPPQPVQDPSFVTAPVNGRGSRAMQVFFVNGRFTKCRLLTAALEEGYRNQLLKGRFPGCVLEVTLPVTAVDVNVHPAKTQVKFAREHEVFEAVYHTVMDALEARGGAVTRPANPPQQVQNPRQDFFQSKARPHASAAQTGEPGRLWRTASLRAGAGKAHMEHGMALRRQGVGQRAAGLAAQRNGKGPRLRLGEGAGLRDRRGSGGRAGTAACAAALCTGNSRRARTAGVHGAAGSGNGAAPRGTVAHCGRGAAHLHRLRG